MYFFLYIFALICLSFFSDVHKSELSVVTNSHDGKNSNVNVKAEYDRNLNSINAHIVAQTPLNALKTIDLQVSIMLHLYLFLT